MEVPGAYNLLKVTDGVPVPVERGFPLVGLAIGVVGFLEVRPGDVLVDDPKTVERGFVVMLDLDFLGFIVDAADGPGFLLAVFAVVEIPLLPALFEEANTESPRNFLLALPKDR